MGRIPAIKEIEYVDDDGILRLAQEIVVQSAKDYRKAAAYLKKHPHTRELDAIVEKQAEDRRREAKERKEKGLPTLKGKRSKEEKLLDNIKKQEQMLFDVEGFLKSKWCAVLTEHGELILRGLREEATNER